MNKIPVYLLNGALGSGKTTLLAQLLQARQSRDFVIENEIANTSVDDLTLDTPNIHTIAGECVCCSDGSSLVKALLYARDNSFEAVFIESTGAASMANLLVNLLGEQFFIDNFRVQQTLLVIDALALERTPPSIHDLAVADTVIVSKLDLVSPNKGRNVLKKLLTLHKNVLNKSTLHIETVLQSKSQAAKNLSQLVQQGLPAASDLPATAVIDMPKLVLVSELVKHVGMLERAKGFIATQAGPVRFESTAEHYEVAACKDGGRQYLVLIDRNRKKIALAKQRIQEMT